MFSPVVWCSVGQAEPAEAQMRSRRAGGRVIPTSAANDVHPSCPSSVITATLLCARKEEDQDSTVPLLCPRQQHYWGGERVGRGERGERGERGVERKWGVPSPGTRDTRIVCFDMNPGEGFQYPAHFRLLGYKPITKTHVSKNSPFWPSRGGNRWEHEYTFCVL